MKQTTLYVSCLSALAISSAMAGTDEADLVLVREGHFNDILSQARLSEQREAELGTMRQRIAELEAQPSVTSGEQVCDSPADSLSSYQLQLLSQWQARRIGSEAWLKLKDPNLSFSGTLFNAIQENLQAYPEKVVEILYVSNLKRDFRLKAGKIVTKIYIVH